MVVAMVVMVVAVVVMVVLVLEQEDLNKGTPEADSLPFLPLSSPWSQWSHGQPSDLPVPSSFRGALTPLATCNLSPGCSFSTSLCLSVCLSRDAWVLLGFQ